MKPQEGNLKNLEKFNKRIEFDSELIRRRFATADRKHQLLLKNQIVVGETPRRDRNIPSAMLHQVRDTQERVYLQLDLPSPSDLPHFSFPLLQGQFATVCTLDNNLQLCGAMGTPRMHYVYGEGGPPDDLYEKLYFENLTTDSVEKSYSFLLNGVFPLMPFYWNVSAVCFDYDFIFPVGSSGTYCFYPLTEFLGTISYVSSGAYPGALSIRVSYTIEQNGDLLGGDWGDYAVELYNDDLIPLALNADDFNYDRSVVALDSEHSIAEISVLFILCFYNGRNDDGHFILDCSSQGGKVACDHIKWGKERLERMPEVGPGS